MTKQDILDNLRLRSTNPDDDNIKYKKNIEKVLMRCPDLLYALNEKDLEPELFNEDGTLNVDADGNPLGEWDRYFGDNANIRPYLFIPQTQTEIKHYVCYQTNFTETLKYKDIQKYGKIVFNIFIHGEDRTDLLTGIPRHDLIGSIIKDKINWTNIFGIQCHLCSDQESSTDNNYVVRTLVFETTSLNSITQSSINYNPNIINKLGRM